MLTAVFTDLVRWLPVTAAVSMRQTSEELLPALGATRARIADSIARICQALLPSLQDSLASALLQAGMSSAEVMAVRAHAWRLLDECNQHMLSSAECWQSIALALLRLSVKFILTAPHADICLRFLPQWPGLQSMECRLMMALWTSRRTSRSNPRHIIVWSHRGRWRGQDPPGAGAASY